MRHRRPFAKPWKLEEQDESLQIRDAAGRILANVYFEDEPTRRNFSKRFSKDGARRMVQQILRLPEPVRIAKGIDPSEAQRRGSSKKFSTSKKLKNPKTSPPPSGVCQGAFLRFKSQSTTSR